MRQRGAASLHSARDLDEGRGDLRAAVAHALGEALDVDGLAAQRERVVALLVAGEEGDCPGRKPPFLVFNRPARPYKSSIQNGFS